MEEIIETQEQETKIYVYVDKDTKECKARAEKNILVIPNTDVIEVDEAPNDIKNYKYINNEFILNEDKIEKQKKQTRYTRLQKIFKEKWLGIQAMIIDKYYMTDEATIKSQIESYKDLALEAKRKLENDPDNPILQAIVSKYEQAMSLQFDLNLLMQTIRGVLEDKIEANDDSVDELLDLAESVKLTKDDLTSEKIEQIKSMFGV